MNNNFKNDISSARAEKIFKKYLMYDLGVIKESYENLTESYKENLGGQIVATILDDIKTKMIDNGELKSEYLLAIYKTKGDIKKLEYLNNLQESVFKLEKLMDEYNLENIKKPVTLIIQTMVGLNKYSSIYVDAFRNKKTLLILQYVGIIRSLITAIVYVLSKSCDITGSGEVIPKTNAIIDDIMPIKALEEFVNIVDYNNLTKIAQDVSMLREGFVEYTADQLYFINESRDVMGLVIDGVNNIYDKIVKTSNNPILSRLLYKTSSVIMLVLSLRNMFFTNFRMNNNLSGLMDYIDDFNNTSNGKIKSGINNTSRMIAVDIENASDNASFDVKDQDKDIFKKANDVKLIPEKNNSTVDPLWTNF